MSRLARSDAASSLTGTRGIDNTSNIALNRASQQAQTVIETKLADYAVTNSKLADGAVTQRVIADAALVSRHFPGSLVLERLYGQFRARSGNYQVDGDVTFYAAASSGGPVTQLQTLTFEDGLLVAVTQT